MVSLEVSLTFYVIFVVLGFFVAVFQGFCFPLGVLVICLSVLAGFFPRCFL